MAEDHNTINWSGPRLLIFSLFLLGSCLSNLAIIVRILGKYWKGLRPVHVYLLNYFAGLSLHALAGVLTVHEHLVTLTPGTSICIHAVIIFCARVNMVYDIIIMQMDRLLAFIAQKSLELCLGKLWVVQKYLYLSLL